MPTARPQRIDKAYQLGRAARRPRHDAHGHHQRGEAAIPTASTSLFMYMANMSWNSAMNVPDTLKHLTAEGSGDRRLHDPAASSTPTPMPPRWCAYADLILPDTTYLERWDCISLLDRPISRGRRRRPMRSASRWWSPTATCGPSRTCCSISARGSGLPGMTTHDGTPRYPGGYADYIVNHERAPGHRPAGRLPRPDGKAQGRGAPNPEQLAALHRQWLPLVLRAARSHDATTAMRTGPISTGPPFLGFVGKPEPIILQLYCEPLQKFRLAARRATARSCRPPRIARASRPTSIPFPSGIRPSRAQMVSEARLPAARRHAAADGHVSLLGLAERLAAPDPSAATGSTCSASAAARARHRRRRLGDWSPSHHGRDQGAGRS